MEYTTQMNAARKGILTSQMKDVLAHESIAKDLLLKRVAEGKIVIPANKRHPNITGKGVGEGLTTKINVNLGVSEDCCNMDLEIKKVKAAVAMQTDAIMDLSTFGDTRKFRRKTVEICPVMIGTVPVYDAVARYGKKH
jgi:phosphomethylpyrimidine synthase